MNRKAIVRTAVLATGLTVFASGLTACASETTLASTAQMCAYTVGSGEDGKNRAIDDIKLPSDTNAIEFKTDDKNARYFPCGSRNYVVNASSEDKKGNELLEARTKDGTRVLVSATALWMVNQNTDAIKQFISLCEKYSCASGDIGGGSSNFSTEGWQGMLAENFHSVLQEIADKAVVQVDDNVWKTSDVNLRSQIADAMSEEFKAAMRTRTGYTEDLFCGSSEAKGEGEFDCTNVRIVDVKVEAADENLQRATENNRAQQTEINEKATAAAERIRVTEQLYGPELARQMRACQDFGNVKCFIVIGPQGAEVRIGQ